MLYYYISIESSLPSNEIFFFQLHFWETRERRAANSFLARNFFLPSSPSLVFDALSTLDLPPSYVSLQKEERRGFLFRESLSPFSSKKRVT